MVEILTGLDLGPAPINGYVGTKAFWQRSPETVVKLVEVWFRIVTYFNAHLDEGAAAIVAILNRNAASGFTVQDFKAAWNRTEHFMASKQQAEQEILQAVGRQLLETQLGRLQQLFPRHRPRDPEPGQPRRCLLYAAGSCEAERLSARGSLRLASWAG